MSNDNAIREETGGKLASCVGWILLFGLAGVATTVLVNRLSTQWIEQKHARWSRAQMAQQMEQLKRDEIHCLVQPDPRFINDVLDDMACAAKIRELDLGGDLSDDGFERLRELPNLECIVFLFAYKTDVFLERLHGMGSLKELNLVHTWPSPRDIELIGGFRNLKSLSLPVAQKNVRDLEGIKRHPAIENLILTRTGCDRRLLSDLLPILQSLPRLRSLTIEGAEEDKKLLEESFRKALPNCRCSVALGP